MSTYKTQSIILKRVDWRENDRLFSLYTKDLGKVVAVSKGVKKIQSKLAGHLEPFLITNLMIARGKNVDQIATSQILKNFSNLKADLKKIVLATYCSELVDQLTKPGHRDEKIFNLLQEVFERLNNSQAINELEFKFISSFFTVKLLTFLGYKPELYLCVLCKKKAQPDNNLFSPKKGGLVCNHCQSKFKKGIKISPEVIKILRLMIEKTLEEFLKVKLNKNLVLELEKIVDEFLNFHLDKELKSRRFIPMLV